MCSILGFINSQEKIEIYNSKLSYRGPDNAGILNFDKYSFAHNRLAIQDLDSRANQPLENSQFILIFNGEIYNHFEIRKELKFQNFQTSSDTETILWAFSELGIEKAISKFIGMFAIALFEKKTEKLYLIRDRVGIKPLYYSFQNNEFIFASELKAFPDKFKKNINLKAQIQLTSLGYIPNENTYFQNIFKLPPAHYLIFKNGKIEKKRYWNLPEDKLNILFNDAVEKTEELIKSAVNYRLISDLEVGAFLSGGVDSSLVTAIASQKQNLKTFSIGFENRSYDESPYAEAVAKHLKTEHFNYRFSAQDVLNLLPNFDDFYDEPFGDASALPTLLLSKFTKSKVTVALSGDGGDELFYGYDRYFFVNNYYQKLTRIPPILRKALAFGLKYSGRDKLEKMAYPVGNLSKENLYSILTTAIKPWELQNIFSKDLIFSAFNKTEINYFDLIEYSNFEEDFSRVDFHRYLPDDILTKVDRASMRYSLEARVPLLDHRLVEFAYQIPNNLKGKKDILKTILSKYIPQDLINRPKKGFAVPLKEWFRRELKEELLSKINNLDYTVLNKQNITKIVDLHINKNKNYEYLLWNLMRLK
jgi:asparagine synthase (glutamine-hydrolysing)